MSKIIHNSSTNQSYIIKELKNNINIISEICELFPVRFIELNNWNNF